jgi:hypothetical protein
VAARKAEAAMKLVKEGILIGTWEEVLFEKIEVD